MKKCRRIHRLDIMKEVKKGFKKRAHVIYQDLSEEEKEKQ